MRNVVPTVEGVAGLISRRGGVAVRAVEIRAVEIRAVVRRAAVGAIKADSGPGRQPGRGSGGGSRLSLDAPAPFA